MAQLKENNHHNNGLSLIDLVLTIACIAVIGAFAIPNMNIFYQKQLAEHSARQLLGALMATRSAAVHARKIATLCPSRDAVYCSRKWDDKLMIFIDKDKNGKRSEDEDIIHVRDAMQADGYMEWRAFRNPKYYIQYRSDGSTNYHNGTFAYCPPINPEINHRQIVINRAGRPRLAFKHEQKSNFCKSKKP